jgi:hypothetical protein
MYRRIWTGLLATVVLFGPAALAHAQVASCPVVDDAAASQALGVTVHGKAQAGMPAGTDMCDYIDPAGIDYSVSRQSGAFAPGAAVGAGALALMFVPQLPADALSQIDSLSQNGTTLTAPGFQISAVNGVGDAALLVKAELMPGIVRDSLFVQHSSDAWSFVTDDTPETPARLTALAQAALGSS